MNGNYVRPEGAQITHVLMITDQRSLSEELITHAPPSPLCKCLVLRSNTILHFSYMTMAWVSHLK